MLAREVGRGVPAELEQCRRGCGCLLLPRSAGEQCGFYVAELGPQSESEKPPVAVCLVRECVSSSAETDGFQLLVPERETAKGHGN